MNVRELIEALSKLYSPLSGVDPNCVYEAESTWSCEIHVETLTDQLRAQGFSEEDTGEGRDVVPTVVLFPVN